jgi:Zn-dependent oligopeptidase
MDYYNTLCTFGHIVGGYASGYYTYKWSDAIQADLFSVFQSMGLLNPETGTKYRSTILARGNEIDPDIYIREFLGREFTPDAFYKDESI